VGGKGRKKNLLPKKLKKKNQGTREGKESVEPFVGKSLIQRALEPECKRYAEACEKGKGGNSISASYRGENTEPSP